VVIDYVCTSATLEAGARALGRRGRLVILGGAAQPFNVAGRAMLLAEQSILGSRYVTRAEILETCDLVARGVVRPLVTELRPLADAELIHDRVERGLVTGRAVLQVS
jgi:propanol-preferring alcohol dehydrogenase